VTRARAILGSGAFLVAPATIAALIPWLLTGWHMRVIAGALAQETIGGILVLCGLVMLLDSFVRFVLDGLGTPAPIAPTQTLVIRGFYRYVRNPMYFALIAMVAGQAILFGSWVLLGYALVIWTMTHAFVVLYEEPRLRRRFGSQYEAYCAKVPRWLPLGD
jgi:protein-S-isoprenylcysteine O-methyltransferase Ste14